MTFKRPSSATKMPAEMTMRQKAVPRDSWLVASLLRLPRIDTPRTTIADPSVTKPESGANRGQFLAKYPLKSCISDVMRNTVTRELPWLAGGGER